MGTAEDQVTARPVSAFPPPSRSVAVACVPAPCDEVVLLASVTVTVSTGFPVTVRAAVPAFPSLVAVMIADPGATAVTAPVEETVAVAVAEDDHVTARPVSTLPEASRSTAVAFVARPAPTLALPSVTVMVETGAGCGLPSEEPPQAAARSRRDDTRRRRKRNSRGRGLGGIPSRPPL